MFDNSSVSRGQRSFLNNQSQPFTPMNNGGALPSPAGTAAVGNTSLASPALSSFTAITMGEYLTAVINRCEQRGLDTTATFLGELTVSLSDAMLTRIGAVPTSTVAAEGWGVNQQQQQEQQCLNTAMSALGVGRTPYPIPPTPNSLFAAAAGGGAGATAKMGGGATPFTASAARGAMHGVGLRHSSTTNGSASPFHINTAFGSSSMSPQRILRGVGGGGGGGVGSSPVMLSQQSLVESIVCSATFTTALSLFHKGQYRRCFEVLSAPLPQRNNGKQQQQQQQQQGILPTFDEGGGRPSSMTSSQQQQQPPLASRGAMPPLLFSKPKASFLGLYALYMEGEKRKFVAGCGSVQSNTAVVEGLVGGGGGSSSSSPSVNENMNLAEISRLIPTALRAFPDDAYLLWLDALVLRGKSGGGNGGASEVAGSTATANIAVNHHARQAYISALLDALTVNPLLWCAWEDLLKEITHVSEIEEVSRNLMAAFSTNLFFAATEEVGEGGEDVDASVSLPLVPLMLRIFRAHAFEALSLFNEAAEEWEKVSRGGVPAYAANNAFMNASAAAAAEGGAADDDDDADTDEINNTEGGLSAEEAINGRKRRRQRTNTTAAEAVASDNANSSTPTAAGTMEGNKNGGLSSPSQTTNIITPFLFAPTACPIVQQHVAVCLAGRKDPRGSIRVFADLHIRWPSRLEGMEEYSNALFVTGDRLGLSTLAQHAFSLDPFSAIANVVVGNYYAVMRKHDRSVYYFRRAVQIDPSLVSAWTLLGHEYLEVKNPNAAAEAYRAALRVDARDYRAWHSLGQIYELHRMYPFALHYLWHTVTLKPRDPRMWQAVASVLEKLNRTRDMIACLENAEQCEGPNATMVVRRSKQHATATAANKAAEAEMIEEEEVIVVGDMENYATIVRAIARCCLMFDLSKAIVFMAKLIACEAHKEEDEVHFLPMLIRYYIEKAKRGIAPQLIAHAAAAIRSGIVDADEVMLLVRQQQQEAAAASAAGGGGYFSASSSASASHAAVTSSLHVGLAPSQRAEQLVWLDAATEYLLRLSELVTQHRSSSSNDADEGAGGGVEGGGGLDIIGAPPLETLLKAQGGKIEQYDMDIIALRTVLTATPSIVS